MKKIGIFGGTFDPIHIGHLILADRSREQFALDSILIVPAAMPPHKPGKVISPSEARFEMVNAAVQGSNGLAACDIEIHRSGTSYTVDTMRELHQRYPDTEFYLLIGGDNLKDFGKWREPVEIARLAKLCVAGRPGQLLDYNALAPPLSQEQVQEIQKGTIHMPLLDISSREIRSRVKAGLSINYIVPQAVQDVIRRKGLYL